MLSLQYFADVAEALRIDSEDVAEWLADGGWVVEQSAWDVIRDTDNDDLVTDRAAELGMVWPENGEDRGS